MQRPSRQRGFTLVELLVALAVSSVVLMGIVLTFISQTRQYQAHAGIRESQGNARISLTYVNKQVRLAGYGIHPDRAIVAYDGFDAQAPTVATANMPDGIVVHRRNPTFKRTVTSISIAGTTVITFDQPVTAPLPGGTILMLICQGSMQTAYVVIDRVDPGVTGMVATVNTVVPVADTPVSAPGPRFRQAVDSACFQSAEAYKVDRYAFYVQAFDDDADATTPLVPYLMLHRGLDLAAPLGTIDGADGQPVARGVEQLQVAYILNTLDNTPPLIAGVQNAPARGDTWAAAAGPAWDSPYDDPSRITNHPSNIRQVRVTVVARAGSRDDAIDGEDVLSTRYQQDGAALSDGAIPWRRLENVDSAVPLTGAQAAMWPQGGALRRTVMRTAVTPKNLLSRSPFLGPNPNGG